MTQRPKVGGMQTLRVTVVDAPDSNAALLGRGEGGSMHDRALADSIRTRHPQVKEVTVRRESPGSATALAARFGEEGPGALPPCDVVVISGHADLITGPMFDYDSYVAAMGVVIGAVKERLGAHAIFLNAATRDPHESIHRLFGERGDPFLVRAHKLNLALIELSYVHGVSIIDVDRIVAELGAEAHVQDRLTYSREALEAIRAELMRVLEDIGFFQARPMLMQIGNPSARPC